MKVIIILKGRGDCKFGYWLKLNYVWLENGFVFVYYYVGFLILLE